MSKSVSKSVAANTLAKINNMDDKICFDFFKQLIDIKKQLSAGKNINDIKIKNPTTGINVNYNGPAYNAIKNRCYNISSIHPDLKKILDDFETEFNLRVSHSPPAATRASKKIVYKTFDEKIKEIDDNHIKKWKNDPTKDPFVGDEDYKFKGTANIESYLSLNCKYSKLYIASVLYYLKKENNQILDEINIENIRQYLPTHHIIYGNNNTEYDYLFVSIPTILSNININNIYDNYIAIFYSLIFNKYSILENLTDIINNTNIGDIEKITIQSIKNNTNIINKLYDVNLKFILIYIKNILDISNINVNVNDKSQLIYYKNLVNYYNNLFLSNPLTNSSNRNLENTLNNYLRVTLVNTRLELINSHITNNFNVIDFMTNVLNDIESMFELSNKQDERQSPLSNNNNNPLEEPIAPRKPQLTPDVLKYLNRLNTPSTNITRQDYINKYLDTDYEIYLENNDISKQDFINKYISDLNGIDTKLNEYNNKLREYNIKYHEYKVKLEEYNKENKKYLNKRVSPLGSILPPHHNKNRDSLLRSLFTKDSPDIKPNGKFDKNKVKCTNKTDLLTQDELEELPLNKLQLLVKIRTRKYHDIDDINNPNCVNWTDKDWTNNKKNELIATYCYDVIGIYNHIIKCVNENKEPYDPYIISRKLSKENIKDILKKIKFITKNIDTKLPVKNINIDKKLTLAYMPYNFNPNSYNNTYGMWYYKLILQVELGGIFFNLFNICILPADEKIKTVNTTNNNNNNVSTDLTSMGIYTKIDKLFETNKLLYRYTYPFKKIINGDIKIIEPPILFNRYRTINNWEINSNGSRKTLVEMKDLLKELDTNVNSYV
jgi:hypothetical protein